MRNLKLSSSQLSKNLTSLYRIKQAQAQLHYAYTVPQAARYLNNTKNCHAIAIKQIIRYLKKIQDKFMFVRPDRTFKLSCYFDSNFRGLFRSENPKNYCFSLINNWISYQVWECTNLVWISKLETQIGLSTIEAEYIVLSQSMQDPLIISRFTRMTLLQNVILNTYWNTWRRVSVISCLLRKCSLLTVCKDSKAISSHILCWITIGLWAKGLCYKLIFKQFHPPKIRLWQAKFEKSQMIIMAW